MPYPGSDLWDTLESQGELTNFDYSNYTSYPTYTGARLAYVPKGRTAEELMSLQAWGMRRAMFRSRVIFRELAHFKWDKIGQYKNAVKALLKPRQTTNERNTIGASTYRSP